MRGKKVQHPKSKDLKRAASPRSRTKSQDLQTLVTSLLSWFFANARDLPWRRTREPYAVWVSEIMLQQTQVKTVIPYYERWMRELPDIRALALAPSEKIHKLWEGLGYYTRVRNMQKAGQTIVETHGGRFPTRFDDVLALSGIGRYTAGAICSIAFNQPTPILDGNVIRVLTRVFSIRENAREKETNARLWNLAEQLVSEAQSMANSHSSVGNCSALNQSLMELGALVCSPRQPKCSECSLARICVARREGIAEQLPNLGERIASTARRFVACVVERDGSVLVRQRPAGVVNGHLWEFPNVEVALKALTSEMQRQLEAELGCSLDALMPLATVKHSITRYRITLEAFRGQLNGVKPHARAGKWVSKNTLEQLPFTSAHRRVLLAALKHDGKALMTR